MTFYLILFQNVGHFEITNLNTKTNHFIIRYTTQSYAHPIPFIEFKSDNKTSKMAFNFVYLNRVECSRSISHYAVSLAMAPAALVLRWSVLN